MEVSLTHFLRFTLIVAIAFAALSRNWSLLFATSLILILTFLPEFFEKKYKIMIPDEFELGIILFIYASLFLGEIFDYYAVFPWWDLLLHIGSGVALGFVGFIMLFTLYYNHKVQSKPIWISVFAFFFALGIGALWEIFEFTMDQTFGMNMQRSGLMDTMWDLIVDAAGALLTSAIGYYYFKRPRIPLFSRIFNKFVEENPDFFKEKKL
ncbi:hypothetical protein JW711_04630 [Candidatus Woesearchaeota archaeon]|nr:hypothetical protein [Candidatus Woesearchaeota archaeon]